DYRLSLFVRSTAGEHAGGAGVVVPVGVFPSSWFLFSLSFFFPPSPSSPVCTVGSLHAQRYFCPPPHARAPASFPASLFFFL
ncbi:hypothetical protein, partial [Escherichia coli]|uniref:hypothetical protein n=1 Tax=Escherichia coli TaxID=562 RepID=UPI003F9FA924